MAVTLSVNGRHREVDVPGDMPLLWVVRDELRLTGTKFGCGVGACGACTVHLDGVAARSCIVPVGDLEGVSITTIEGLSPTSSNPVQLAWVEQQVPQCGYCQSGMIMTAAALLAANPHPTDDDITRTMTNICRCATYTRIRAAIKVAAGKSGA